LAALHFDGIGDLAVRNVHILITHLDMVPDANSFQNDVVTHLERKQVPPENIFFAWKDCTWNEADLVEKETKINDFVKNLPNKTDWLDYLQDRGMQTSGAMHISSNMCTRTGCKHEYSAQTKENLKKLFTKLTQDPRFKYDD
jgi:hypothetical protein